VTSGVSIGDAALCRRRASHTRSARRLGGALRCRWRDGHREQAIRGRMSWRSMWRSPRIASRSPSPRRRNAHLYRYLAACLSAAAALSASASSSHLRCCATRCFILSRRHHRQSIVGNGISNIEWALRRRRRLASSLAPPSRACGRIRLRAALRARAHQIIDAASLTRTRVSSGSAKERRKNEWW